MCQKIWNSGDALYTRGFNQFKGKTLDEVAHEQGAKAGLEGNVEQDEAHIGIIEPGLYRQIADRHHQDLERDEIAGHEHEEDEQVGFELVDCQGKACHAGKHQGADHGGDRHIKRIEHVFAHGRILENLDIVLPGKGRRHSEIIADCQILCRTNRGDGDAQ